jgi:hypothetical protein
MMEVKAKRMEEIRESRQTQREKKKVKKMEKLNNKKNFKQPARPPKVKHFATTANCEEMPFQFPASDYEIEGVKDGVTMFRGTKAFFAQAEKSMESLTDNSLDISDEDEDLYVHTKDESSIMSDSELGETSELESSLQDTKHPVAQLIRRQEEEEEAPEAVQVPQATEVPEATDAPKAVTKVISHPEPVKPVQKEDSDDEAPEMQPIKRASSSLNMNDERPKSKKAKIVKKQKNYAQILKRPRRPPTLLEKLLNTEMEKERYEVLQCLHYVVSKNFFGTGT